MGRIVITLPGITPVSWNRFYRSHWAEQASTKKEFEKFIWAYTPAASRNLQLKNAKVEIWAFFKSDKKGSKYCWIDADNLCAKPILDGIKGTIIDDDPHHIDCVACHSRLDEANPRTEIIIIYEDNSTAASKNSPAGGRAKRNNRRGNPDSKSHS
jgi:hypothetical protein